MFNLLLFTKGFDERFIMMVGEQPYYKVSYTQMVRDLSQIRVNCLFTMVKELGLGGAL